MTRAQADEQARHWHDLTATYSSVTDAVGTKIDSGILATVIGLNAFGFRTTGSCEGHDTGSLTPYVDIAVPAPREQKQQAVQALHEAQRQQVRLPREDAAHVLKEAQQRFEDINQAFHLPVRKRLVASLDRFYSTRQVAYQSQLGLRNSVLHGFVEEIRLENIGADLLVLEPLAVQRQKRTEYQAEMQAFAQFLQASYIRLDSAA